MIVDLAALAGLVGIVVGVQVLRPTDLGFDPARAVAATLSWIPVTLPAAILVLATTLLDLGAGLVIARAVRGRPFERLDEALLQGFVMAVVKDVAILGVLAGFGLFRQPILIGLHVAILGWAALRLRPILGPGVRPVVASLTPFSALLLVAWAAPVILQLASPIVPFTDILPNHVAPAEHLRTFGTLTHLTDTQSPIYGPSRIFLGYSALLGVITTVSGLPAGVALAGFILPSTLLVAVSIYRLAGALGGPEIRRWALLVFATTTSFARLSDARATVIVLPLAAWVLATLAERMTRAEPGNATTNPGNATTNPGNATTDPGDDRVLPLVLGLGLGASMLLHPVIGFLTAITVLLAVLLRPARIASFAIPALAVGALIAAPQAATMLSIALPPFALDLAVGAAVAAGLGARMALRAWPVVGRSLVTVGRAAAVAAAAAAGLGVVVIAGPLVHAAVAGAGPLVSVMELSIVAGVAAIGLRAPIARNPVLWAALAASFGVAGLTQLVPEKGSGLLGAALRFELPKTLQYWAPVFMAILAAGGIDAVLRHRRLPLAARGMAVVAVVGTAALPIRATPIDAFHLGEHRLSETLSIAMRWAQSGFWVGFPDSRYIVDAPRKEILEAVRAEIAAGRIGPNTAILHVAGSFQQWVATPLGVFDGVTETDVTPDAVTSIHTVGGRLHPLDDLAALLASRTYRYLLFEPDPKKLPAGTRAAIVAAGYTPIFGNQQGELLVLGR